jgi:hypothetical protein
MLVLVMNVVCVISCVSYLPSVNFGDSINCGYKAIRALCPTLDVPRPSASVVLLARNSFALLTCIIYGSRSERFRRHWCRIQWNRSTLRMSGGGGGGRVRSRAMNTVVAAASRAAAYTYIMLCCTYSVCVYIVCVHTRKERLC